MCVLTRIEKELLCELLAQYGLQFLCVLKFEFESRHGDVRDNIHAKQIIRNAQWHRTECIQLRGVTYHSRWYRRVQRGSSRHVCFAHLIPGEEEIVDQFAEVQYYLYCEYNGHKWCIAGVKTHQSLTTADYLIPDRLRWARLADKCASGLCFIHAASLISRVMFMIGQVEKLIPIYGEERVKPMFISSNVDHRYEF
jgi:hypothetical protein